jgi:ArsR family transcriptional regulator
MIEPSVIPSGLTRRLARRFALLSVPARLRLVKILLDGGEKSVQEIVEASGLRQANVSKHLGHLADEGLLGRRKEGLFVFYRIADPTLTAVCSIMCGRLQHEGDHHRDETGQQKTIHRRDEGRLAGTPEVMEE